MKNQLVLAPIVFALSCALSGIALADGPRGDNRKEQNKEQNRGSMPIPLKGSFVVNSSSICSAEGSTASYAGTDSGQAKFSEAKSSFSTWASNLISLAVTDPNTLLPGTAIDPSSTTTPAATLVETPQQWGTLNYTVFRSSVLLSNSTGNTSRIKSGPAPFLVTNYAYSNILDGIGNGKASTGQALYIWDSAANAWQRYNMTANKPFARASYIAAQATYQTNVSTTTGTDANGNPIITTTTYDCLLQRQFNAMDSDR